MISCNRAVLALSVSAIAMLASPAAAQVQGADDVGSASGDIIVTATRQDQLLSKVPVSVAAFTKESMDRQGVRDINDIARITPGLTFSVDAFGPTSTNISIRGVSSSSGAATTGVYIDDVAIQIRSNAQGAFGSAFPRIFDLDRIEVLRGPQGTLFGAGAQGGVVRFITPTPDLNRTSVYSRAEVSSTRSGDPSYEAGVAVGTPLVADKVGLRLSAYYRHDGGFVDRKPFNLATPNSVEAYENVNSANIYALRGALAFELSEVLRITPSVYYQRTTTNDSGTVWSNVSDFDKGEFVSGYAIRQPTRDRFVLPSLNVTADLGSVEMSSVTAYFDRRGRAVQDYTNLQAAFIFDSPYPFIAGWQAPGLALGRQKVFSQEVRLSSTDRDARVRWTAGVYYSRSRQQESTRVIDDTTAALIPPFGNALADGLYVFAAANNTIDKQLAAFAQIDADVTDKLTATVGLRYSQADFDFLRDIDGPINGGFSRTTGKQRSKPFTPKFGLSYQIDDDNMLYATAAKGFRGGGVNPPLFDSCVIQDAPASFGPDTTWSYEAGSKNKLFGGALRIEASAFYIKWQDIQQFVLAGCAGNGFRDNIGAARSRGFDLQFSLKASDQLQLSGSVGYIDAKYEKTVIVNDAIFARGGDALPGSPWQLIGNIDYTLPALSDGDLYFHADARYNSHNNGRLAAQDDPRASGYDPALRFDPAITEVNLRVGLRTSGIDASLFVNNLFDTAPLLAKYRDTPDMPLFYYRTTRPRTAGLTVSYRY